MGLSKLHAPHDAPVALVCAGGFASLVGCGWLLESSLVMGLPGLSGWADRLAGILAVLAFVVVAAFARRCRRLVASAGAPLVIALGGMACAGRALAACRGFGAALPDGLLVVGNLACVIAEAALLVCWFAVLCGEVSRDVPFIIALAYLFIAAASLVARAIPAEAVTVIVPLLPLVSAAVLARAVARGMLFGGVRAGKKDVADPGDVGAEQAPIPAGWSFPVRPVVLMVAFTFAFSFSLALSRGPNPYGQLGMLAVAAVALLVALLADKGSYSPAFLYKLALPLMVGGLVALAFLDGGRSVAVMFTNSANIAFTLFMAIALCPMCYRYAIEPFWVFGIVQACSRLAVMAGRNAGVQFVGAMPLGSEDNGVVVCIVVVVLVTLSVFFFNDRLADASFGLAPTSANEGRPAGPQAAMTYYERIVWRCSQVAREYGLTQREQEVLELMAQGLTANDIAEKTFVSYGTVKTHVNHIYKKLDVHSREAAIALVGMDGRG